MGAEGVEKRGLNCTGRGVPEVELALCGFRCMDGLSDVYVQRARPCIGLSVPLAPVCGLSLSDAFARMERPDDN